MSDAIFQLLPLIVPFLLVLFRIMGLFVFVPVFSNAAIPANIRVLLAVALSCCLWHSVPSRTIPLTLIDLTVAVACEMGVGLLLGLATLLVFTGAQLGTHMISQQMGLAMAAVYDPMFEQQSTVIEQLAFWLNLVVFLTIGGHRELIHALMYSYHTVPMGQSPPPELMLQYTLASLQMTYHVAVQVAAPGLVAFFISTLVMGFVAKTMPQINLMTIGLPANLMVGFIMLMTGLAAWATVAHRSWTDMFVSLRQVLG